MNAKDQFIVDQFSSELLSPAFQWGMDNFENFSDIVAEAAPIIRAGYQAFLIDSTLPADMTGEAIMLHKEFSRCIRCRKRFYRADWIRKGNEVQEKYIAMVEAKLPERMRIYWRTITVHGLNCYK